MRLKVESPKGQQTIVVGPGREPRLTDILRREHLPLNIRCGQRGLCDGCIVELVQGKLVRLQTGQAVNVPAGGEPVRLRGCEYAVAADSDTVIRIPPRSLLAHKAQVVSEFKTRVPRAHDPIWQTVPLPVNKRRAVRHAEGLTAGATGHATLEYRDDHWLVTGLREAAPRHAYGAAVDIGTTTVAVMLTSLDDGRIVARAADFNKQMHLGDDVATRIGLCATDKANIAQLQDAIVKQTLAPLIAECLHKAGAQPADLVCLSVAANTTMLHLFAGVDPSGMGVYPFVPAFLEHRAITLPAFGRASVHLLPSAASYIGADITAGVFASGLAYDDGPSLLVDVGTNGEIVLKAGNQMLGCATAAGPAFEGAGLTNGIRAGDGAIQKIHFDQNARPIVDIIGGGPPIGVCGSAYVDFLAEGRRAGLLTSTGRFEIDGLNGSLRLGVGLGGKDVLISETDTAHLLQSKAAIGAGIETLLARAGLKPAEIKKVYMAGGFGMHLNIANAIDCGLLPGFVPGQVEVVGNTSLAGAYLAMLDCGALDEIARVAQRITIIELNLDPAFEERYIDNLALT